MLFRYNNETYKILDIAWDKDPTYQFTKRDGSEQTLAQYYQEVRGAFSFPLVFRIDSYFRNIIFK